MELTLNFKWVVLAVSMLALGVVACGDSKDGGGGGGGSGGDNGKTEGGICDEGSSKYDEQACEACGAAVFECFMNNVCSAEAMAIGACVTTSCESQSAALDACEEAADERCTDESETFDEYVACFDAACVAENAAVDTCAQSQCVSEANAYLACFKRDCPDAAECVE